jgi:parallel beta-helix repeat protein
MPRPGRKGTILIEHPAEDSSPALNQRRALLAGMGGLAAGAFLAGAARTAHAGPLDPPPGPIAPTPGPEPRTPIGPETTPGDANNTFRITQPGSYYLAGNIVGEAGKVGILIEASDVRLDLNGFSLLGVPGAPLGILAVGISFVGICNGTVRGFGTGIESPSTQGVCSLRDVVVAGSAASGILVNNGRLSGCSAIGNAADGFAPGGSSTLLDCIALQNAGGGFVLNNNASLERCVAAENASQGFRANGNAAFYGCAASGNANGFFASAAATLQDCIATDNSQSGIVVSGSNPGGVIRGCTARFNQSDGIVVSGGTLVHGNTLYRNGTGSAGIRVTGPDNRIEANNCIRAGIGIQITTSGNLIIGNSCSGNTTNYSIVAGNRYGPVVNLTPGGTPAVNGNFADDTTSSHPWANFAY